MASIHTTHLDGILLAETEGPVGREQNREALRLALSADRPCVVLDLRGSAQTYTFGEALRAVLDLEGHPGFNEKWVALVNDFDNGFELTQTEEHAAQTKGLALRAFTTMEAALGWLKGSSGSPCAGEPAGTDLSGTPS